MTPASAYRRGYRASARPGRDLERDEAKFIQQHGMALWHHWSEGWEDYAMGREPKS